MRLFGRIGTSSFVIFISFVLATVLLVVMGIKAPDLLNQILDLASWVEARITHTGLPHEYNNWVRLFVDDAQLTMIFFVIVIRIFLAVLGAGIKRLFRRREPLI